MRRVLMVSYHFPPLGGMGSIRAQAFVRMLPEFGWEPVVVTPRHGDYTVDPSLRYPEERVVRTASLELSRVNRTLVGAIGGGGQGSPPAWKARLRRFARDYVYRPDAHVGWAPFAIAAGWRALRRERFDVIFSSALPITAHLVARRLHQITGLPWIAEFRDLWSEFTDYDHLSSRSYREGIERRIFRTASAVVTVSPTWAEVLSARGAPNVAVVTNGFEPDEFPSGAPTPGLIAYLGTYYPGLQDLPTALAAIAAVRAARGPEVRFHYIGEATAAVQQEIASAGLGECTEVTGLLPQREGLLRAAEAAVLILAGPTSSEPRVRGHIPGKAFEYMGSGRPILYCGALDTDVARVLSQAARVRLVGTGDVDGARRALDELLRMSGAAPPTDVSRFTRRAQCAVLARVFDRAADGL